ncbi:ATP synthase I chain [Desulfacinum hydrothermale DSM 13146]|uniref:ATP synthase I chain n=1 Tax=Desulfacinum hydrothermale DSM 13146 TaxID=1121390 RepID=A0A1W1XKY8_9BACT|nr:ATP synthase subunit I [Desulfacinum hydrothermale]SMC24492.1 ATP synthase I chain [Desulfacinum hydrothermale DSM 13146]
MRAYLQDEKLVRRIELVNVIFLLIAFLAALLWFSKKQVLGVVLGGATVTASFRVMGWQLRRALANPRRVPSKGVLFVKYYVRFLGTLFVVFAIIYYGWVDPVAFLVGLSSVMVSIVVVGLQQALNVMLKGER